MRASVLSSTGRAVAEQPADTQPGAIAFGRLARAAAVTAVAAIAGDLLIYFVGGLWGVPGEYAAFFNPATIVVSVLAGVAVAAGGLAVLSRLSRRGEAIFRVAAAALTLLSLAGPVQALAGAMPGFAAATLATGVAMIAMHLITGGAIAVLLPTQARR
jgi:hypothetical protein